VIAAVIFSFFYLTSSETISFVYISDICVEGGVTLSIASMWIFIIIFSGVSQFLISSGLRAFGIYLTITI
jgi:hypothetical protein